MAATKTANTKHPFTVPDKDVLGRSFPGIWINGFHFEPGKTYEVDETLFGTLRSTLDDYTQEALRTLRSNVDLNALQQLLATRGYWAGIPEES